MDKLNNGTVLMQSLYWFVINQLCYVIYLIKQKEKEKETKKRNKNIEISKLLSQLTNELFIVVSIIHNNTGIEVFLNSVT